MKRLLIVIVKKHRNDRRFIFTFRKTSAQRNKSLTALNLQFVAVPQLRFKQRRHAFGDNGFHVRIRRHGSFLHLHQATLAPLLIAAALWVCAIVLSISALVPINNRIASLNTAAPAPGWERDHRKWDAFHRVRILLLMLALLIVVNALVA